MMKILTHGARNNFYHYIKKNLSEEAKSTLQLKCYTLFTLLSILLDYL